MSLKSDVKFLSAGAYDPEVIEEALNQYYDEGWTLKNVVAPVYKRGFDGELLIFLEKRK